MNEEKRITSLMKWDECDWRRSMKWKITRDIVNENEKVMNEGEVIKHLMHRNEWMWLIKVSEMASEKLNKLNKEWKWMCDEKRWGSRDFDLYEWRNECGWWKWVRWLMN